MERSNATELVYAPRSRRNRTWLRLSRLVRSTLALTVSTAAAAHADVPVSGKGPQELAWVDQIVQDYKRVRSVGSAIVAIANPAGCVVYQRGFNSIPENAPMRIASIEKPLTAELIYELAAENRLSLGHYAFYLGQPESAWLGIEPAFGLGDDRLRDVTIEHLLHHQGGWYQNESGDPMFQTREIVPAVGGPLPGTREDVVRYVLSRPLDYTPGTGCDTEKSDPGSG